LYIPISPELKYKAKVFIDMFLNRFAKGLGALALLIFLIPDVNWEVRIKWVSGITFVFIVIWAILNLKVSKEYTNIVKQKLKMKWGRADTFVEEELDVDYTKLVFDLLESRDRSSVLYAMHIHDLVKQGKLTPEVKKLLSYESSEIKISSLGGLLEEEATTWAPDTSDFIDEELLQKEVDEIMSLDVYQEVIKNYMDKVLVDKSKESETAKMEVAKAIGMMDSRSSLAQKLDDLLHDDSPDVVRYALESAARLKKREYVPDMIQKLSSPIFREDASVALKKFGEKVTGTVADYLADSEASLELRKGIASVLAHIGNQEAVDFLTWELARNQEDLDTELIDALDKIRLDKPGLQFLEKIISPRVTLEIKKYYRILVDYCDSKSTEAKLSDSPESLNNCLMNIFKLLGLLYPREDIIRAYQNIKAGTKESVAYAFELLDNILKKEIKDFLFPIIEDLPLEEKAKICRRLLKNFPQIRIEI
jgi:HEAT repeat protein